MQLNLSEQSVMRQLPEFVVIDGKKLAVVEQRGYMVRAVDGVSGELEVLPFKSVAESVFPKEDVNDSVSTQCYRKLVESKCAGKRKVVIETKLAPVKETAVQGIEWVKEAKRQFEDYAGVVCEVVSENDTQAVLKIKEEYVGLSGGTGAIVFASDADAVRAAEQIVKKDVLENVRLFSPEFVGSVTAIFETDRKQLANMEADRVCEGLSDDQVCAMASAELEDEYDDLVNGDFESSGESKEDIDKKVEDVVDEAKRVLREKTYTKAYAQLGYPVKYFVETGAFTVNEAVQLPVVMVDVDGAAKRAVAVDGAGSFFDGYVGTKVILESGAVAFVTK